MRKLWAAFFVALSVLTLSLGWQPARAEGSFSYTGSFDFDAFLMEFTEEYPDRSDKDENSRSPVPCQYIL